MRGGGALRRRRGCKAWRRGLLQSGQPGRQGCTRGRVDGDTALQGWGDQGRQMGGALFGVGRGCRATATNGGEITMQVLGQAGTNKSASCMYSFRLVHLSGTCSLHLNAGTGAVA